MTFKSFNQVLVLDAKQYRKLQLGQGTLLYIVDFHHRLFRYFELVANLVHDRSTFLKSSVII